MRRTLIAIGAAGVCVFAAAPAGATFPGANGRIAFSTGGGPDTQPSIATMEPDGSNVRDLTRGVGPAWSADGRRIVFSRSQGGRKSDIYVMRANGSDVRRLTFTPNWADGGASFSPDGSKIVFGRIFQGSNPRPSQLVVMRLGDLRTRVLATDAIRPEWAPNGRHIAFVDDTDNSGSIATMRPDGTDERRLTSPQNGFDGYPAYAPGGRTIYFDRFTFRGPVVLMRVGAFGGHAQRLPTPISGAGLYSPAPAPAGGCIVGVGWQGLYARGGRCPVQGWLDQPGDQPSWQSLPSG
jgi:hypothetical protein